LLQNLRAGRSARRCLFNDQETLMKNVTRHLSAILVAAAPVAPASAASQ